jgi:tRNA threonylcarbamoyladenosine biosynthesis protein TsaE
VTLTTQSEAETMAAGRALGASLEAGAIVLLTGDLGAGKTAFVRGLAEALGINTADVSSPTFTIIQEYRGGRLLMRHVDLYRLTPREVDELGLDEMTLDPAVTAIEWPDRLPRSLGDAVQVRLAHAGGDTRTIEIERPQSNP